MRVLILGGTGAIGVSLKSILVNRGDEVYITSRGSHKDDGNIHYLQGDAHDGNFMSGVLKSIYDAIVDFMLYRSGEFKEKAELLLSATEQYIFTSSGRVYADSKTLITEESPRLLDVCKDRSYLKTDEYALAKAREENILLESMQKNWTIIRPYITYNVERLQLGAIEKDIWLHRALHDRSIPLPKDVATHQTTMTYGGDVAAAIAALIGNKRSLGEIFNLTGTEHMTWSEVLDIYLAVLEKEVEPKVYALEDSSEFSNEVGNTYQVYFDRLYDRVFDNSKLISVTGELTFRKMEDGLSDCLAEFLMKPRWRMLNCAAEACINRQTGEKMSYSELNSSRDKIKYFGWYHIPKVMRTVRKLKKQ